jgi:hypothetical protein
MTNLDHKSIVLQTALPCLTNETPLTQVWAKQSYFLPATKALIVVIWIRSNCPFNCSTTGATLRSVWANPSYYFPAKKSLIQLICIMSNCSFNCPNIFNNWSNFKASVGKPVLLLSRQKITYTTNLLIFAATNGVNDPFAGQRC